LINEKLNLLHLGSMVEVPKLLLFDSRNINQGATILRFINGN